MRKWLAQTDDRGMLTATILFKIVYLTLLAVALRYWPDLDFDKFSQVDTHWPQEGPPTYATHFSTWDAAHYVELSRLGYRAGDPSSAFAPAWPVLLGWCSSMLGASPIVVGVILANLCSTVGWLLFYRHVGRRFGARHAGLALVLLVVYPGSLFFQLNYTESLFFLLLMVLWDGLDGEVHWKACLAGFLLPLTRVIGLFALLPIAWSLLRAWRRSASGPSGTTDVRDRLRRMLPWVAVLCAPGMGWIVYLGLMARWTGNPWEGFAAQRFWGVHSAVNLIDLPHFLVELVSPTRWHGFAGSAVDRITFLIVLALVPTTLRLKGDLVPWLVWLGLIPAMSGSFTSYLRFASCCFPVFVGAATLLGSWRQSSGAPKESPERAGRGPTWRYLLVALLVVAHAVMVWRHVNYRWAG